MKNKAFTLIELAISMLVISILIAGAMTTSVIVSRSADIKDTKKTMSTIEEAIENYLIKNQRLPCPASLTLIPTETNFGEELRDGNDECDTTAAGIFTSTDTDAVNLVYGTVPIRNLNLSDEFIADNWNNKISYVVDKRFTKAGDISGGVDGFAFTSGYGVVSASLPSDEYKADNTLITITSNGTTNTVTPDAAFTLISHGENGLGAYGLKSTAQNSTTGIITDESENIYASAFNPVFVSDSSADGYDDIVYYKTKIQLVRDIDWGDVGCAQNDGSFRDSRTDEPVDWSSSAIYGKTIAMNNVGDATNTWTANTSCYMKTCGKYGRWSNMTYCNPSNKLVYTDNLPVTHGLDLWLDAADVSTIGLHSSYDYTTMNVGTWHDKSGRGNDVSQAAGTSTPFHYGNGTNGMPAINYSGASDYLENISPSGSSDGITFFIVLNSNDNVNNNAELFRITDVNDSYLRYTISYDDISYSKFNGITFLSTSSIGDEIGTGIVIVHSSVHFFSGSYNSFKFTRATSLNVNLYEVLLYNTVLSSGDINSIKEYLSGKYGTDNIISY